MRLNARLSDAEARQLEDLCAATGESVSEIVRLAIRHYHQETLGGRVAPRRALERSTTGLN